jgi:hypothetical protein
MTQMNDKEKPDSTSIPPPASPPPPKLSADALRLIEHFLQVQSQEIETRQQEITAREKESENAHQYALKSLEVQADNLEKDRQHKRTVYRDRLLFATVSILVLAIFLTIALFLNKDQIAIEIVKAIVYLAVGGLGGYAYHQLRSKQ